MNVTRTRAEKTTALSAPGRVSPTHASMINPPISGKVVHTATFIKARCQGRRETAISISADAAPIAAAGAGPKSAIASTSARKEPEIRIPRNSMVSESLPTARTRRSRTSSLGVQSPVSDVATTTTVARINIAR